jgi:hypothetical protein
MEADDIADVCVQLLSGGCGSDLKHGVPIIAAFTGEGVSTTRPLRKS